MRIIRFITIALFCLFPLLSRAQPSSLEAARIELIRQAVIFYSYIPAVAPKGNHNCDAKSLEALKECAKGFKGVDDRIKDWGGRKVNNKDDLKYLKSDILKKIKEKNSERESMPQYKVMDAAMDTAIAKVDAAQSQQPVALGDSGKVAATPVAPTIPTADSSGIPTVAPVITEPHASGISPETWGMAALAVAIAALITSIVLFRRAKESAVSQKQAGSNDSFAANALNNTVSDLKARQDRTEANMLMLNEAVSSLRAELVKKPQQAAMATPASQPVPAAMPQRRIKYAKTADGNGFDASTLSDDADHKKIFEITIEDNGRQASFRVTPNADAQQFALTNTSTYLAEACDFSGLPDSPQSRIQTTTPGRLELQGGKWKIISKARIVFN